MVLTFYSVDQTTKYDHSLESVVPFVLWYSVVVPVQSVNQTKQTPHFSYFLIFALFTERFLHLSKDVSVYLLSFLLQCRQLRVRGQVKN